MLCLKCPTKLDFLDRVPFLITPASRSSMDQSHADPRRSPFGLISFIMLHGMSTCSKQILVGALSLSKVALTVPTFLKPGNGGRANLPFTWKASLPILFIHFSVSPLLSTENQQYSFHIASRAFTTIADLPLNCHFTCHPHLPPLLSSPVLLQHDQ